MKMNMRRLVSLGVLLTAVTWFAACSGKKADSVRLQGAGASFPAPLYLKWFKTFSNTHPNVQVDYQSVGSGSGVKSFMDKTVDFAASDAAMKPEDMAKVEGGVQLLPMTAGSIVLAYNLPDVPKLQLPRDAYVGIFLGKVKSKRSSGTALTTHLGSEVSTRTEVDTYFVGMNSCLRGLTSSVRMPFVRALATARSRRVRS
jgi:phosphate transport system substrate-binding protein